MNEKPVKCKDCGYLALVHIEKSPPFPVRPGFFPSKEVDFPRRQPDFYMTTYEPIRCHVGKADLDEELRTWGGGIVETNPIPGQTELKDFGKWQDIITQDRECDGFTPYMQGLSPNDHLAEERERQEKRSDRRHEYQIIALTT